MPIDAELGSDNRFAFVLHTPSPAYNQLSLNPPSLFTSNTPPKIMVMDENGDNVGKQKQNIPVNGINGLDLLPNGLPNSRNSR